MLEIFRELRGLLHVSHVHIDSWVFRLHYSVTTTCMLAFSIIVSANQYVGNPIDCIHSEDIPEVRLLVMLAKLGLAFWLVKLHRVGGSLVMSQTLVFCVIFFCIFSLPRLFCQDYFKKCSKL